MLGLAVALQNIDKVIEIIRSSSDTNDAREKLIKFDWKIPNDKFILNFINSENKDSIKNSILNYQKLKRDQF